MTLVADLVRSTPTIAAGSESWRWPRSERLLPFAVPIGLILLWQLASSLGLITNRLMPAPVDVVLAFWSRAVSGELATDVSVSAARAVSGLVVGGSIGFLLGIANGLSKL